MKIKGVVLSSKYQIVASGREPITSCKIKSYCHIDLFKKNLEKLKEAGKEAKFKKQEDFFPSNRACFVLNEPLKTISAEYDN